MGRKRCYGLTERQKEVLRHVAQGQTNQEIAENLAIELQSVHNYLRMIRVKLNLWQRTQLAIYALQTGLISLDEIELPTTMPIKTA